SLTAVKLKPTLQPTASISSNQISLRARSTSNSFVGTLRFQNVRNTYCWGCRKIISEADSNWLCLRIVVPLSPVSSPTDTPPYHMAHHYPHPTSYISLCCVV